MRVAKKSLLDSTRKKVKDRQPFPGYLFRIFDRAAPNRSGTVGGLICTNSFENRKRHPWVQHGCKFQIKIFNHLGG